VIVRTAPPHHDMRDQITPHHGAGCGLRFRLFYYRRLLARDNPCSGWESTPSSSRGFWVTRTACIFGPSACVRPRRQDGGAVVARHLEVSGVRLGVVAACPRDAALEIVGDQQRRQPAEESERRAGADHDAVSELTFTLHDTYISARQTVTCCPNSTERCQAFARALPKVKQFSIRTADGT